MSRSGSGFIPARRPIFADNNVLVAAAERGNASALADIRAVVVDHERADAALAAFAKATGFEAVTLEQRLTNFLTHTHPRLGVPLRSMP